MTATRIVPDVVPRHLRPPLAAPTRNRATANAVGRTAGAAAPGPARQPSAPTTPPAPSVRTRSATPTTPTTLTTPAPPVRTRSATPTSTPAPPVRTRSAAPTAATARPLPQTGPQPRPQPARRAPLRIVTPPDPEARARRRRRLWVGALAGLACAGLFAIVGVRVLLAQGQGPVDRLETELTAAQAENQRLRLDVATLESPSRIVAEARSRLGMVPPPTVIYLPPLTQPAG